MRLVNWIGERFWATMLVIIVMVLTLSIAVTNFYFMPQQEQARRDYISDCKAQGGKYVELHHRQYCIIDGVKV